MSDAIDKAIAGAAEPAVTMAQVELSLAPDGRPAVLAVPLDITEHEALMLAGYVTLELIPYLSRAAAPPSRVWVPPRVRDA